MFFYKFLVGALYPLVRVYLALRRKRGKEDADSVRFGERFGRASAARPRGFLIWLHGASVGELNSLRGLVARIRADYPRAKLLVTSGTVTSSGTAKNLDAIHQYIPIDVPFAVRRFMKHWHPDLAIRVDSELWPIQLDAIRRAGIPSFMVNGAVTAKTFRKWMRHNRGMAKHMAGGFTTVMAKSDKDAMRLASLGAQNVMVMDNLKYGNPPPACNPEELAAFRESIGSRPSWHAAVVGEGESEIIFAAHRAVLKKIPNALLIITPRHPSMKAELARTAGNLKIGFRSDNAAPGGDVYVADTMGEMGLFYRCANAAFMGRSLLPDCRGSSPIEAMQTGNVVTTGPYTSTFDEVYDEMIAAGILQRVGDPSEIAAWAVSQLRGGAEFKKLQADTQKFIAQKSAVLDTVMDQLREYVKA
ncbi:MAG: 3-deoxy-D-manno-octulosonic acid transferase [Proteobacteria bacterium]|nr:3-deoxy-D-manno-octulosonic acid transferase [Pseudomonadota bacterium]